MRRFTPFKNLSWLLSCVCIAGSATAAASEQEKEPRRQYLSAAYLFDPAAQSLPVTMPAFTMPAAAALAGNIFQGRLRVNIAADTITSPSPGTQLTLKLISDAYGDAANPERKLKQLPVIDIELVQSGHYLIPLNRSTVQTSHPYWDYRVGPGRVWQERADGDYSRASLPFSLQEKNANCTHNGVLSFLFNDGGDLSNVALLIASETCAYLQFDAWATFASEYSPYRIPRAVDTVSRFHTELDKRLPVKPMALLLADDWVNSSEVNSDEGNSSEGAKGVSSRAHNANPSHRAPLLATLKANAADSSAYGLVVDGVNYLGGCATRFGDYPYCEVMALPSYSLAKTLFAATSLMWLEKNYPGAKQAKLADYIPQCRQSGAWSEVSFEQALDMVTGHYQSAVNNSDESSSQMDENFFIAKSHAQKIHFSCNALQRQQPAGQRWVYHSSDTYLLTTAMNNFIKRHRDPQADIFNDVYLPLWQGLALSPMTQDTLRTIERTDIDSSDIVDRVGEKIGQPFGGYGLMLQLDDIARMAGALNNSQSVLYQQVDRTMLDAAMQRVPGDSGFYAADSGLKYNNGIWALNVKAALACEQDLWLPFMSGYGGISVVMMPNNTLYYNFGDNQQFAWLDAARLSHSIRPLCPSNS